ncbi:membrane-associated oxidoreductase [Streptomyces fulvoviolaceus]|uniref:membrane-associated oxidoreductase n=1 Tax=Streptomyces fulvoviolaceus TaxID=285535 RepID=UPI0021C1FB8B|nr:membrane-associated oxidoreductase [Streptomyces fulvoviolaceus]MCT9082557.1 membrane-associated oxidoreductase [Streptomyces fulvoviolaceus]
MEIDNLTPAELRVWRAFPRGESVDFRTGEDEDTAHGADWESERAVRATVLRALLLNGPQEDGEIPALKLSGARITGLLNLQYGTVDHAVRLSHCFFEDAPLLYGSRLRQLNLSNSVLPGLVAATMRMEGVLRLTDCQVRGPVRLGGAQIAGALFMDRAEITPPDTTEPALQLNHVSIGDDLWAPGLRTHGEVRLNGASVAGSVNLNDARLSNPGDIVLDAQTLVVESDFHMRRLVTFGWIGLRGARIAGRLDLSYARLSNPGDAALRASSCTIGELWLRKGPPMEGTLTLRRAQIDELFLEPEVVPDEVQFNGLVYTSLTPQEPTERRLPMLERDREGYVPHAYEQLTAAYRRIGDDHAARLVQLAKQRRHRMTLPWYGRLWGRVQDATVGYGFHPLRACGWLLSLLAVGSVAFALHHPPPLKADEAPEFNPVFYTLDLLLPVISFGQESAFAPKDGYQALSYALVIAGWILATTVFAGVTRTVSRQ